MPKLKTVVIGGGFAGLSAAFSLALKNHDVTVINDRDYTLADRQIFVSTNMVTRFFDLTNLSTIINQQMVITESNTIAPALQLELAKIDGVTLNAEDTLDLNFFQLLAQQHCVIPIKEFQAYQRQKFEALLAKGEVQYILNDSKVLKFTGTVQFLDHHLVTEIDTARKIIVVKNLAEQSLTTLPFDHLVAADGAKHTIATMLGSTNTEYQIAEQDLTAPKHNFYGIANFTLNSTVETTIVALGIVTPHIECSVQLTTNDLPDLCDQGWQHNYVPFIYSKLDLANRTCYLTGEIPETLMDNPVEISNWFKLIAAKLLQISKADITSSAHLLPGFKVKTKHLATNFLALDARSCCFMVGDAWLPANFLYGHGIQSAIEDGNAIYACFNEVGEFMSAEPMRKQLLSRLVDYDFYFKSVELSRVIVSEPALSTTDKQKAILEFNIAAAKAGSIRAQNVINTYAKSQQNILVLQAEYQIIDFVAQEQIARMQLNYEEASDRTMLTEQRYPNNLTLYANSLATRLHQYHEVGSTAPALCTQLFNY